MKRISRISVKIITTIILCIVFVAMLIGILSSAKAAMIIEEDTYDNFRNISLNYANQFSLILAEVESTVHTLSTGVQFSFNKTAFQSNPDYRDSYMDQTGSVLQELGRHNPMIQGIYLAVDPDITGAVYESWYINDGKGNFVYQEAEELSTFYPENEDMKWYYDPVKHRRGVWSLPYTDATINVKMISYTKAIFSGGELIGVAGIDISFDDILKTVENMAIHESGYGILMDSDYRIISHPALEEGTDIREIENEDVSAIVESMDAFDSRVITYYFQGKDKIMGFSRLSNRWIFMAVADLDDINRHVIELRKMVLIVVLFSIAFGTAVGLTMSRSITSQLNKLHEMTARIGEGDFNVAIEKTTKDEIGALARSFSIMSQKLAVSQSKLLEMNESMKAMAFHDPLTHLPNRRYCINELHTLLSKKPGDSSLYGIMSIDLDHFKEINDTRGHDVGDMILTHAAEKMNHQISGNDDLCRFGGDEFLLIFRKVPNRDLVRALADRLLQSMKEPLPVPPEALSISCSIGIVIIDWEDRSMKKLLKQADLALYEAKEGGRDRAVFHNDLPPRKET